MRYLSVCSGIEAATQAFHPLGWEPVAFSEIEPFPSAVLAHHYPSVPNWGDMTHFEEWPDEPVDLLCGGTPCQSFSVAGLRQGLADPRGNLMLTFGAIAGRYRPRWLVWENVPGVLSANGGRDFGTFLGMLGQLGYGVAYRVLDAQHVRTRRFPFAVPQRRRRVWVVAYLGDWRRAAAVLFDRESLSGHPAPRREAGQIAPTIPARSLGGGGLGTDFDCDGGLIPSVSMCLNAGAMGRIDGESETFIPVAHALRGEGFDASEDGTGRGTPLVPVAFAENSRSELRLCGGDGQVSAQLTTGGGKPGQGQPCIISPIAYGLSTQQEPKWAADLSPTLARPSISGGGQVTAVAFDTTQITSPGNYSSPKPGDACHPLAAGDHAPAVAFDMRGREGGAMPEGPHHTANIRAASGGSSRSYVAEPWAVRRLTPVECEALQGFPPDFTAIPWRGKPAGQCPDGPRYKALGNSWAVNCAEWIAERIDAVEALEAAA